METVKEKRPWQSERLKALPMDKAPRWKGEAAGYRAKHYRIVKLYGKAHKCENIDCPVPNYHRFEWANLDGNYSVERAAWLMLCVTCHRRLDKSGVQPRI